MERMIQSVSESDRSIKVCSVLSNPPAISVYVTFSTMDKGALGYLVYITK